MSESGLTREQWREVQELLYGAPGVWAFDAFAVLNRELFYGELEFRGVRIEHTGYGHAEGLTFPSRAMAVADRSFRPPKTQPRRSDGKMPLPPQPPAAVLCHEMVRAWLKQNGEDAGHDSDGWVRETERISRQVAPGLPAQLQFSRPKSRRVPDASRGLTGRKAPVRWATPPGAVPWGDLVRWPQGLAEVEEALVRMAPGWEPR